jgi:hypothetical protein
MGIRDEGMVMAVDKTILYRFIQNPFFLRRKPNLGEAKDETEVVDRLRNSSRSGSWVLRQQPRRARKSLAYSDLCLSQVHGP